MKVKTADLKGAALDWAVALIEGYKIVRFERGNISHGDWMDHPRGDLRPVYIAEPPFPQSIPYYSTTWEDGGPLIEKYRISICPSIFGGWDAECLEPPMTGNYSKGTSPLESGMRAIVAAKLGDEVEIPDHLMEVEP